MSFLSIALIDVQRSPYVTRWGIVNVSRPQSVAEHTFGVIAISRDIVTTHLTGKEHIFGGNVPTLAEVTELAFLHDLDEVFTGDIPTPAKRLLGVQSADYHQSGAHEVLKVADIYEALLYIQDHGIGRHAQQITVRLREQLEFFCSQCVFCEPKRWVTRYETLLQSWNY